MGLLINNKKQYLTRFPIGIIIILFIAFLPVLIAGIGAWLTEVNTGEPCNEGNCIWMVFPWLMLISMPVAGVLLLIYLIVVLADTIRLFKKHR